MRKIISICTIVMLILLVTLFVPVKKTKIGSTTYEGKLIEIETMSTIVFVPIFKIGSEITKAEGSVYTKVNHVHDIQMHLMIFLTIVTNYFILINFDLKKNMNLIKNEHTPE